MVDRYVRQIVPEPSTGELAQRLRFSDYSSHRNIVLLGDPGAGKSHLFEQTAETEGGISLTVRNFLNVPPCDPDQTLFLDALDEKRAGRGDDDVVDQIVQKLFSSPPHKVRISCRDRDWLGASDLAAFRPYFDQHGGFVVLSLEELSAEEQEVILQSQGVDDPRSFLEGAERHGVDEFLRNPQSLIMLAQVVSRRGDWPATRSELFRLSTSILLEEPNDEHARKKEQSYGPEELRATAGAICAVRLISDVAGISLLENSSSQDFPSYRTIGLQDTEKARAALGRRVFRSCSDAGNVDYTHRTTAEYLAAQWLATKVREGLSIRRILSLLGIDGRPASELRGLHAWLPVFVPEHADVFIAADPYGVLTYGDAASLQPQSRRYLLEALAGLSEKDPWFRAGDWEGSRLKGLAAPDMAVSFRQVLQSPKSNFALRTTVLDALIAGEPLVELADDLRDILASEEAPLGERERAVDALIRLGPEGRSVILAAYSAGLGADADAFRLRSHIVSSLYGDPFEPSDVATLIHDTMRCPQDLPIGHLWSLPRKVPLQDISAIFDQLSFSGSKDSGSEAYQANSYNVGHVIDRMLLRLLQEDTQLTAQRLWKYLRVRRDCHGFRAGSMAKEIGEELKRHRQLQLDLVDAALIDLARPGDHFWGPMTELREATLHTVESDDLLERVAAEAERCEEGSEREAYLYELALILSQSGSPRGTAVFERLYERAQRRPRLGPIWERCTISPIQEWQTEQARRRQRKEAEEEASAARNMRAFENKKDAIRSGEDLNALRWAALIYFGFFIDSDRSVSPAGRLEQALTPASTRIAIEGFKAVLRRPDLPSLETVVELSAERKHYEWWYAILAGVDEDWNERGSVANYSDDLARLALALEIANPTYLADPEATDERGWKRALLSRRPELVCDVYYALAVGCLEKGEQIATGLRELLTEPELEPFRKKVTLELLRRFPNAQIFRLDELLRTASKLPNAHVEFLSLATEVLGKPEALSQDCYDRWLVAAYQLSPEQFGEAVAARAATDPEIVWLIRDNIDFTGEDVDDAPIGSIENLEFVARIAGKRFPYASHPSRGWSGDRNPWDGARFVTSLIDRISASASEQATSALQRLQADASFDSYRDHLAHALESQRSRRRDAEFRQPNWRQTIDSLSNRTPANVADLHAVLIDTLQDYRMLIGGSNSDMFKRFWNEDRYGRPTKPKIEESCRDVLVEFVSQRLEPLGVLVEPEGHAVNDKRSDFFAALPKQKVPVELKRDSHADVWTAAEDQLDRFYTSDPDASGYGVYGVFWFGDKRTNPIPRHPKGLPVPRTASEMESMLRELIPAENRGRIEVVVIDVSGEATFETR